VGMSLSIITIPSGKDPDELIKQDPAVWQRIIEEPQYAVDWLIDRYKQKLDITTAQGKKAFSDVLLAVVEKLADEVEKEHYVHHIADLLGVTKAALYSKLKDTAPPHIAPRKAKPSVIAKEDAEYAKIQNRALALALWQPKLFPIIEPLTADMLVGDDAQRLFAFMQKRRGGDGTDKALLETLRPLEEYVKILSLLYEELYKSIELSELQLEGERLRSQLIERYIKVQKPFLDQAIEHALQEGKTDSIAFRQIHDKITNLNTLRKKYAAGT
jgi:DNA primase